LVKTKNPSRFLVGRVFCDQHEKSTAPGQQNSSVPDFHPATHTHTKAKSVFHFSCIKKVGLSITESPQNTLYENENSLK
jgi:hypothetical protein